MRRLPALAAVLAVALCAPAGASSPPVATAAAACSVAGKERKLGATYVTSVRATRVSCRRALALVRDYHRCRRSRGGADGRCPRVNGYRCSERRTSSPTQYDSR
ncbi:MAG TPA: hypothetical protein VGW10_08630, partial [Solirubrobacteraceae bacterium]|nr:hypothetical protein [Solirubrobacteraceae bacterium]